MSLLALAAAPLIAGNDIRNMTSATKETLMNHEVIAIDQDALGKQAVPVRNGILETWIKPLADGSIAVGVVNLSSNDSMVMPKIECDLGLNAPVTSARDLWAHRDVAFHDGVYSASVPSHGVLMLRVSTSH